MVAAVTFKSIMGAITASLAEAVKTLEVVKRVEYERGVADGKRQAAKNCALA